MEDIATIVLTDEAEEPLLMLLHLLYFFFLSVFVTKLVSFVWRWEGIIHFSVGAEMYYCAFLSTLFERQWTFSLSSSKVTCTVSRQK